MAITYLAERFFDGDTLHTNTTVTIDQGKVLAIGNHTDSPTPLAGTLVPGFVDVQVNGGGGVLFNSNTSADALNRIRHAHSQFGTTAMMPTLITDSLDTITRAADAMAEAIAQDSPGILGIHFEGPHLSEPKKGIHRSQFIRPITDDELKQFTRQDLGKVMLTVAPENVPADVIADLVRQGVRVCLGHTNADCDTTLKALEAGANGFTHLHNAMSPMTSREPGVVGAALADDNSYCGLIVDNYHVDKVTVKASIKAKGIDQVMLVTDAMAHVGSDIDDLAFFDTRIIRTGDKLTIPAGNLAGSALDMASAVRNTCQSGLSLEQALIMASRTPARYLGLADQLGKLQPGYQADMVLLDDTLNATQTWIQGQVVTQQ
ncbi:N-acetylglucosamine-6-phosphate deacetylase [Saliniradius amylolyticus]|uniref:N-acetylgalactosamine-6-phosphate deacetylase n=1 Tax=Saliniradius amylolyticus TaxID=2183582 RepID=A0A2S2E2U0_9ALTE|nr:N-acetylglucosamine-6-phosphate deacetylase [Saliniradius amylolyticus]AWL11976.1 N-acetylglucosamine-6-phosphate deacetylase [Saliniradius amylolyticus]